MLKRRARASELLKSRFMAIDHELRRDQRSGPMMMEPVGGMDRVVGGFMAQGRAPACARARRFSRCWCATVASSGLPRNGKRKQMSADYCLNCIPMHLLAGIEHNFPNDYAAGSRPFRRGKLFKIGLQMKERFWEREGIYGGISWTLQDIRRSGIRRTASTGKKGVMLGGVHLRSVLRAKIRATCPRRSASNSAIRAGREDSPRLRQLHRKRRERRVAPDESHARLRGAMG